jgi:hypothetical protein
VSRLAEPYRHRVEILAQIGFGLCVLLLLSRKQDRLQVGNVQLGGVAQQHVVDRRSERQHGHHHGDAEQRELRQPEADRLRLRQLS